MVFEVCSGMWQSMQFFVRRIRLSFSPDPKEKSIFSAIPGPPRKIGLEEDPGLRVNPDVAGVRKIKEGAGGDARLYQLTDINSCRCLGMIICS